MSARPDGDVPVPRGDLLSTVRAVAWSFLGIRRKGGLQDDMERTFAFWRDAGAAFLPAYLPIVERHRDEAYGERERRFQLYRRGRYVEFNLVFDRGTLFGLQSGGRTESILMSMPPIVKWRYDWHPTGGTPDAAAARRGLDTREARAPFSQPDEDRERDAPSPPPRTRRSRPRWRRGLRALRLQARRVGPAAAAAAHPGDPAGAAAEQP